MLREHCIQGAAGFVVVQKRILAMALNESATFRLPLLLRLLLRLPGLRNLPARLIAFGPRRVCIE